MTERVQIGQCTLYRADCREIIPMLEKVHSVITDPPYSETTMKNARTHLNKGFGRRPEATYIDFSIDYEQVAEIFALCSQKLTRWLVASMEFRHAADLERSPPAGLDFIRIGAWIKTNCAPQFTADRPAQGFETIAILHATATKKRWNGGGSRAVWITEVERNNGHPTPKPVKLIADWVEKFTDQGEIVLDPFMGSGTTGVACAKLGRRFVGVEIDPRYFDLACKRIEEAYRQGDLFTGGAA